MLTLSPFVLYRRTFFMEDISRVLQKHQKEFSPVVSFSAAADKLHHFDFTEKNTALGDIDIANTDKFSEYINNILQSTGSKYGIGGYDENRVLYRRSPLFDGDEPWTIHLGIDIWGAAGTKLYAPIGGMIHSFAFNNEFGDYGATVILLHQLDTIVFHTLYGHLGIKDIAGLQEGKYISRGELIGHFGQASENGNWPPHLHFQLINDLRVHRGDYPGVCNLSERELYLKNCPDPDLILQMMKYAR